MMSLAPLDIWITIGVVCFLWGIAGFLEYYLSKESKGKFNMTNNKVSMDAIAENLTSGLPDAKTLRRQVEEMTIEEKYETEINTIKYHAEHGKFSVAIAYTLDDSFIAYLEDKGYKVSRPEYPGQAITVSW